MFLGYLYAGTPFLYLAIRLLFKLVLKVFYSSIVIENPQFVPSDGVPCILCANHSNSLTDALILITSVPLSKRRWLRMTAKSTLFGLRTFSSWLIESVGTVPIKRPTDYKGVKVDNLAVFDRLMDALDKEGDMVCLFPEGISHYSSYVAPFRSGVSKIASDVLNRNSENPNFKLTLLTCSITYLHREAFRSDVLVRFNPPIELSVKEHKELFKPALGTGQVDGIRQLTGLMQEQIRQGTLDAPDFGIVRIANTARRLYAPFGTSMTLGDTVQITQRFVDVFARQKVTLPPTPAEALLTPAPTVDVSAQAVSSGLAMSTLQDQLVIQRQPVPLENGYFDVKATEGTTSAGMSNEEVEQLKKDLHAYQDTLNHLGIKDDRVRKALLPTPILLKRLAVRLSGACCLFFIASPGLVLWLPIFATASFFGWRMRTKGKLEDVWDEIAHTKLIYGLLSGVVVWSLVVLLTFPFAPITFVGTPVLMWFSLRWLEDALSSLRAAVALLSILAIGQERLSSLSKLREELHSRVLRVAVERAELPEDLGTWLEKEKKLKERGGKVGRLGYFSVRRRRKKDYNEVMRLWDKTEYPT